MPPDKFRVALVQMSCGPEPEQNLAKALERVADAAGRGAQVVCLPELFQTQYFCQREDHSLFDLAEPIPGPSSDKLAAAAKQNGVVLIASLFEKRAPGIYHNTAAIFDSNGALAGLYRKMHIPDDPLYYEKFYFTPGDLGFRALDTSCGPSGHAGLLGSMVSRGRAADGAAGGIGAVLSDGDRLASFGESGVWRGAARCMAHDSAGSCDCQWSLCCGSESSGI